MDLYAFLKSLLRSAADGIRRNKLPAFLSAIALVLTVALAFTSEFDERPHYRKYILPEIDKAESRFFGTMREAGEATDEIWRLRFFLDAHRNAKAALRVIQAERPMTEAGRKAQHELVHYYELVDEELAIIRTEMSINEDYDYVGEWNRRNSELVSIRKRWASWIRPPA